MYKLAKYTPTNFTPYHLYFLIFPSEQPIHPKCYNEFIELIQLKNDNDEITKYKSIYCSWKLGKEYCMQLNKDTIEEYYGKTYMKIKDNNENIRKVK